MAPQEFTVEFQGSEGQPLGLAVTFPFGTYGVVKDVQAGLMAQWNLNNPPEKQVRVGDCILEINGVSDRPEDMKEALTKEKKTILVRRPDMSVANAGVESQEDSSLSKSKVDATPELVKTKFTVELHASEGLPLGLSVSRQKKHIIVKAIKSGLVGDWNAKNPPERQVREGDEIISINGVAGHPDNMLEALKEDKKTLLVQRSEVTITNIQVERQDESSSPQPTDTLAPAPDHIWAPMPSLDESPCLAEEKPSLADEIKDENGSDSLSMKTVAPSWAGTREGVVTVVNSPDEMNENMDAPCCPTCRLNY